jgi:hypothetical protein
MRTAPFGSKLVADGESSCAIRLRDAEEDEEPRSETGDPTREGVSA